jgi:hypothetical protein
MSDDLIERHAVLTTSGRRLAVTIDIDAAPVCTVRIDAGGGNSAEAECLSMEDDWWTFIMDDDEKPEFPSLEALLRHMLVDVVGAEEARDARVEPWTP